MYSRGELRRRLNDTLSAIGLMRPLKYVGMVALLLVIKITRSAHEKEICGGR